MPDDHQSPRGIRRVVIDGVECNDWDSEYPCAHDELEATLQDAHQKGIADGRCAVMAEAKEWWDSLALRVPLGQRRDILDYRDAFLSDENAGEWLSRRDREQQAIGIEKAADYIEHGRLGLRRSLGEAGVDRHTATMLRALAEKIRGDEPAHAVSDPALEGES